MRSEYTFFFAALVFMIVGLFADRPAVYISLGTVFLILGMAAIRKNRQADDTRKPNDGSEDQA
ncbi:MAG: hypothetical protein HRF44_03710 [Ignavibacterium sp.]|jgi:hypothetical protein